jgi:hypothetical protein
MNTKSERPLYFVNGPVDFAVIGGLSLAVFAALHLLELRGRTPHGIWLAAWLAWAVNWPHFSATNYRLYRSRSTASQYPFTAFGVPLLVAAGVAGCYAWPDVLAPAFVKLFLLWSPYHFSAQSFGLSLLYARRAGVAYGRLERAALSAFVYSTFVTAVLQTEDASRPRAYFGLQIPRLGVPAWFGTASAWAVYVFAVLFLAAWLGARARTRRRLPLILLLPAFTQFVWYLPGGVAPGFNEFVPFFHSLQYLYVAWALQLRERRDVLPDAPAAPFVARETLHWSVVNFWGGVALFWMLPRLAALFGPSIQFSEPVLIAAVQIHHFFVDGVIWKLRYAAVESPLLMGFHDLLRGPPAKEAA